MIDNKRLAAILAAFLIVAGILCYATYKPAASIVGVAEWHRTEDLPPPNDRPICGMWIDGNNPEVEFVRRVGGSFYEYNPNPFAATALLYGFPPIYWSEMPGAAE